MGCLLCLVPLKVLFVASIAPGLLIIKLYLHFLQISKWEYSTKITMMWYFVLVVFLCNMLKEKKGLLLCVGQVESGVPWAGCVFQPDIDINPPPPFFLFLQHIMKRLWLFYASPTSWSCYRRDSLVWPAIIHSGEENLLYENEKSYGYLLKHLCHWVLV